ncbi:hypothetical protein [Micromonospora sp. NPDC050200]|uniref:hypothetical protein n=1 Tax=Micromonospora sp. NPDC050200 TaxID=3155664 RepID=UPI00340D0C5B
MRRRYRAVTRADGLTRGIAGAHRPVGAAVPAGLVAVDGDERQSGATLPAARVAVDGDERQCAAVRPPARRLSPGGS